MKNFIIFSELMVDMDTTIFQRRRHAIEVQSHGSSENVILGNEIWAAVNNTL